MVAAATNNLCEAANSAVQGHASEEKLISSAKQVAASTAQLLVACKVKADHNSQTMKRLQVSAAPCLSEAWLQLMLVRRHVRKKGPLAFLSEVWEVLVATGPRN